MKQHAPHKIAVLCTLICAGISGMSAALAEDGSVADPNANDVNAMADTASKSAATSAAIMPGAAASTAGCALPALAESLAISQYVAVCNADTIEPLATPALPESGLPTDDPMNVIADRMRASAYDNEQRERTFLILLEEETEPPLPQYDGLRSTNAILLKQETHEREPVESVQASSYALDEVPDIDPQTAIAEVAVKVGHRAENEVGDRQQPTHSVADNQALAMTAVVPDSAAQSSSAVAAEQTENDPSSIAISTAAAATENPASEIVASTSGTASEEKQPSTTDTQATLPVAGHDTKDQWLAAVSDTNLDQMRGGFDTGSGLLVSFGIQRAVYINGNLVTTTSFNIPDVSKVTSTEAAMLGSTIGTTNVVQNGPGNTIQPGALSQAVAATVIQNSLNNQNIQNLTIIDTTTNSLGMLKSMNSQSTLRDALSNSVMAK